MDKIYSVEEAAVILGISPLTLKKWLRQGKKITGSKVGRLWRVTEKDIQDCLIRGRRARGEID